MEMIFLNGSWVIGLTPLPLKSSPFGTFHDSLKDSLICYLVQLSTMQIFRHVLSLVISLVNTIVLASSICHRLAEILLLGFQHKVYMGILTIIILCPPFYSEKK